MMPVWLTYARTFNGLREIPGPKTSPTIGAWLHALKAGWTDDETAWCGTFVAHCLQSAGFALPTHWYRALDWAAWGQACPPCVAAIGVKKRYDAKGRVIGGHVFFLVGRSKVNGVPYFHAYGGNQRDRVCTVMIRERDVIATRWPLGVPLGDALPNLAPIGSAGSEA